MSDTRLLRGIGVSPGVAVGRAVVLQFTLPELPGRVVARKDVPREVRRLRDGVRTVRRYLDRMRERAARRAPPPPGDSPGARRRWSPSP